MVLLSSFCRSNQFDGIVGKFWVVGDERVIFDNRLRDQQAIKRVFVMKRQIFEFVNVFGRNR